MHRLLKSFLIPVLFLGALLFPRTAAVEPVAPIFVEAPTRPRPADSASFGFVPPATDLAHLKGERVRLGVTLPGRFDWRAQGKVSPVRNQGACGSCWAFASVANIESKLLVDGAGTFDLSENNVKECEWFSGSCGGGDYPQVANFLSQKGTVLEGCDPYVAADVACRGNCSYQQTLLGWKLISGSETPSTDLLKQYLLTYGPIYTAVYAGRYDPWYWELYNYDGSYTLYHGGQETPNHAVLLVGWDDDLSHAGGKGAWIVKNSWGANWGSGGFFSIAYGSASIGTYSAFISDWQPYDVGGGLLYYDEGGWGTAYGVSGSTTAWALNRYVLDKNVRLTRVEFWTDDATSDIDIYLFDTFDTAALRVSGLLRSLSDLSFNEAGYHSVPIDPPLPISAGDDVAVMIKVANAHSTYPIVVDNYGPYRTGRSYISRDGVDGSWTDLAAYGRAEVGLRLRYTDAGGGSPLITPTPTASATLAHTPSPTATRMPTWTPTPTPTASATAAATATAILRGHVSLQGRPNPPDARWQVALTITLSAAGRPTETRVAMTDAFGYFVLSGLAPEAYEVRVKNSHTLSVRRSSVLLPPGETVVEFGVLLEGDCTGDDMVDVADFSLLRSLFFSSDPRADLNQDGVVDILDFSLFRSNFGVVGG